MRKSIWRVLLISIISLVFITSIQAKNSDTRNRKAEAAMRDLIKNSEIKGLLAAYAFAGDMPHKIVLGESMTGVPVTADMHFRMGAPAIAILGTMLLQLVDTGQLTLSTRLSQWFPEFPEAEKITLAMLANSSSGIGDYVKNQNFIKDWEKNVFKHWTAAELINYAKDMPRDYQPGEGWNYSHTNFILLGEVLSKATKKSFAQLVQKHIINRLHLSDTEYVETPLVKQPVLHSFSSDRGVYEEATYWSPDWSSYTGSYYTNLDDMLRLTRVIGEGGLISKKSHKAMLAPTLAGVGPLTSDRFYGLGIIVQNGWLAQIANMNGYSNIMAYLPKKKLAIVISVTKKQGYKDDLDYGILTFRKLAEILAPDDPLEK